MSQEKKIFSLSTVLNRVQTVFDDYMSGKFFWIKVEISKINFDRNGHIYMELVENNQGVTKARCRATVWKRNAVAILEELGDAQQNILKEGAEVLCNCEVVFSPVYGFSINIISVDLAFSLGEVERRKQATLEQLRQLGLLSKNKENSLPKVIQRIALVGSVGTAGYVDFIHQLQHNQYGFAYQITPFNCRVQGEGAALEVCTQLNQIEVDCFDVVVLVRGGGSKFDLEAFNDLQLAMTIANLKLPVFTGIGHEIDTTVVDFVAHAYFKTPSAVAAYIVERSATFYNHILGLYNEITEVYNRTLLQTKYDLEALISGIKNSATTSLLLEKNRLYSATTKMAGLVHQQVSDEQHKMDLANQFLGYRPKIMLQKNKDWVESTRMLFGLLTHTSLSKQEVVLTTAVEMLQFYYQCRIKQEHIRMDKQTRLLSLFDVSTMLNRGFAIVKVNSKTLDQQTSIKQGDLVEIEVYNKKFEIIVKDSKEIHTWNNLITKEPQVN